MYQHPAALDLNASYYQHEALREAENRRLVRQAKTSDQHDHHPMHIEHRLVTAQRRMVVVAMALVTVLGVIALI